MSTLRELFKKHGSDKGAHGYAEVYETLPKPSRMMEVGVWKGASLRAWREFWPRCRIIGIDTMKRGEPSVKFGPDFLIVKGDSRADMSALFTEYDRPDLIIDDGSHKPRDQAATFRNLWPLLAPGGVYCIEDVLPIDVLGDNLPEWFAQRSADFNLTAFMELALVVQQSRGTVIRHDFRAKSGKPDSVLIEVRKP